MRQTMLFCLSESHELKLNHMNRVQTAMGQIPFKNVWFLNIYISLFFKKVD